MTNQTTGEKTTLAHPQSQAITFLKGGMFGGKDDNGNTNGTHLQEGGPDSKLGAFSMTWRGDQSLGTQY